MEHSPRIIHEPLGWEHPYEHELVERVPRDPDVGDLVQIYFNVTNVPGSPVINWKQDDDSGWSNALRYEAEDSAPTSLIPPGPSDFNAEEAELAASESVQPEPVPETDSAEAVWVGSIGPFLRSTPVSYEIVAGEHRAGPFTFCPGEYISPIVSLAGDRITLAHSSSEEAIELIFEASPKTPEEIRFRTRVLREADGRRASPATSAVVEIIDGRAVVQPLADEVDLHRLLVDGARLRIEAGAITSVRIAYHSPGEERFFGFGERYDRIGVRDARVWSRVFDQYKHQGERTYLPVPFFLSSLGYSFGILSDHPVQFDLAQSDQLSWSFEWTPESTPVEGVITWGAPKELLSRWQSHTGPAMKPPEWCFTPWISSNEWNTQQRVIEEVETAATLDVPAGVIVLEAWSDEQTFYIWNGATYEAKQGAERFTYDDFLFADDGPWPSPKAMIDELHDRGYRIVLWQIPVQKHSATAHEQRLNDERHVRDNGFAIRQADGSDYRVPGPAWFPGSLVLDMSSDSAWEWWEERRRYLVDDLGVDGFKTDGGEHVWGREFLTASGEVGRSLINAYPREYASRYHRFVTKDGKRDAVVFSRAGYSGSQAATFLWNGDQDSTWEEFRAQLRATLNAGLSGIPFAGWDIGGFSGPIPGPELYIRSAQTAAFSPLMQLHSEYNHHRTPHIDRTPWNIANRWGRHDVLDTYRSYAKLRMHLAPYLNDLAEEAVRRGLPLVAPLFVHFPDDETCWRIDDQYLLGDDVIVAPVLSESVTERLVYLPEGEWHDCWSNKIESGKRWITVAAPLHEIPLFARGSALERIRRAIAACFPKENHADD